MTKPKAKANAKGKAKGEAKSEPSEVSWSKLCFDTTDLFKWEDGITRGAYTSRAYDRVKRRARNAGYSPKGIAELTTVAYTEAAKIYDGMMR